MPVRTCNSAHCSGADAQINEICKELGWPINHPVLTRDDVGPCTCSCSCLAHGTPVQAGDGSFKPIEGYQLGDSVLAAGTALVWQPKNVVFSQGTTGASRQKYTVMVLYRDKAIVVTSDHLFLMADRTLKPADRLTPADLLISPDGQPVPISGVHIGDYTAGFHHIATAKQQPTATLDGHLLNTNGVVSADYTAQLFYRSGQGQGFMAGAINNMPVVGSPEYVAQFGRDCLGTPRFVQGFDAGGAGFEAANYNAGDINQPAFIAAENTIIRIPDNACRFISDAEAAAKALEPMRAWNDPLSREWTEYLIQHHRSFYPNVTYHLDWADNTVNAYAWVENGVRHVALKGGLVRHSALELEGIGLILAHELGHHYGGPPTFPFGLSCEGQADYNGVSAIMRRVWFANQYIEMTDAGIQQMANFFGVPNSPNPPGGSAGCNHPVGACRIATYHRSVSLGAKPGCAS